MLFCSDTGWTTAVRSPAPTNRHQEPQATRKAWQFCAAISKLSILTFPFENRLFQGSSFIRSRQIKTNI